MQAIEFASNDTTVFISVQRQALNPETIQRITAHLQDVMTELSEDIDVKPLTALPSDEREEIEALLMAMSDEDRTPSLRFQMQI